MNDLDQELGNALRHRAESMSSAPLAFDDVRGKATSIRRRRRVASGLAVAAAVAVIVPTAFIASKAGNSDGPLPATQAPTVSDTADPTPTSSPVMGDDPHALGVTDLPTGAPPAVEVLEGNQVSAVATTQEATVSRRGDGVVVEAGGRTFGPYPSSYGLTVNAAGTAVAWSTDEGDVMVWADGAEEPFTLAGFGPTGVRVVAVTGTDCLRGKASDCEYFVSHYAGTEPESLRISGDGGSSNVDPDRSLLAVRDATDSGLVLGITEFDDTRPGTCSAVLEPAQSGSTPLLHTCEYALDEFSPDGSYVLASDTYGDGFGSGVIAIFETAGDRISYRLTRGPGMVAYNDAVWEDETHVLFTRYQDGDWSIVRMDVNGALEYAIPPQPGGDEAPWHFRAS